MSDTHIQIISRELSLQPGYVKAVADLLEEGGTVPFISRYRKEATGSMDEDGEARLYALLRERLPDAALVSVGHRSSLLPFHGQRLVLTPARLESVPA